MRPPQKSRALRSGNGCVLPKGELQDGRKVTKELFRTFLAEELPKVKTYLGHEAWEAGRYEEGAKLFERITTDDRYVEFLTLPAYDYVD